MTEEERKRYVRSMLQAADETRTTLEDAMSAAYARGWAAACERVAEAIGNAQGWATAAPTKHFAGIARALATKPEGGP